MTGHHGGCPVRTISSITCGCTCHAGKRKDNTFELFGSNAIKDDTPMAQQIQTILIDDLDGSSATETIVFALDGKSYEIDLNDAHAAKLREAVAPFLGAARKVKGATGPRAIRRMGTPVGQVEDTAAIRAWAKKNGYEVNDRGRVPASIREAYNAAA
jgi:hypothetical protein